MSTPRSPRLSAASSPTPTPPSRSSGGEEVRYVSLADAVANGGVDGRVVSFRGRLPVACLTVATVPRKATGHADVVSKGVFDE